MGDRVCTKCGSKVPNRRYDVWFGAEKIILIAVYAHSEEEAKGKATEKLFEKMDEFDVYEPHGETTYLYANKLDIVSVEPYQPDALEDEEEG